LDKEHVAFGDLDGDGTKDAVVVLGASGGGSGKFYLLAAVLNRDGKAHASATKLLGDRIIVNNVSIGARLVSVDIVTQGPNDPLCCPTKRETLKFMLQGDEFRTAAR
jgi:hypothetical protein